MCLHLRCSLTFILPSKVIEGSKPFNSEIHTSFVMDVDLGQSDNVTSSLVEEDSSLSKELVVKHNSFYNMSFSEECALVLKVLQWTEDTTPKSLLNEISQ